MQLWGAPRLQDTFDCLKQHSHRQLPTCSQGSWNLEVEIPQITAQWWVPVVTTVSQGETPRGGGWFWLLARKSG